MLDSPNASSPIPQAKNMSGFSSKSKNYAAESPASILKANRSLAQKQGKGLMEFSKSDLMRFLGLLEAELQARDLVINSLKNERAKILRPSKNQHRQYTLTSPFSALQRDSEKAGGGRGESEEEKKKGMDTKDVVASLHAVIEQHRKAEERMKAQLEALKASHTKAVTELEDEKRKHAQDTAQGDDVTYMLEKERERLMQQVDFEKAQQRKLERECKRAQGRMIQERKKHAEIFKLILDKQVQQLTEAQQQAVEWETQAQAMRAETLNASKLALEERNKSVKMEAEMEKKLSEFDIEREQLLGRLHREEMRTRELKEELEVLKKAMQKSPDLVNGQIAAGSELNSNAKGSSTKGVSSNLDSKVARSKDPPGSARKPAVSKPKASAKIYGAKGYKSPQRSDKSEGSSSSSSEDLNAAVPASRIRSVSPAVPNPKTSVPDGKKPTVTSKPKPSTASFTKGAGREHRPLSPASSLDKLSGKGASSSPSSSLASQKGTKIPSSSAMFANSSQLRKSSPTVAVVAPQPSKFSSVLPDTAKQQQAAKKAVDITDSPKPDKAEPAARGNQVSRPTALTSGEGASKFREAVGKAAQLRNALTSPKEHEPRDKSPSRGFGGVNVRAAAAQLTSPVGKKLFNPPGNTPNKLNSSTHSEPSGTSQTKEAPTGGGNTTTATDKAKPAVTSPSSMAPGKRNVSPRGSPPALTRPTLCTSAWESPLHQAARKGDTATLCRLIEEQHDRTSPEKDGSTLIHAAAYGGHVDSLDLLVTLGEDPNTAQAEGLTPLHVAAGEGHEGCVRFLLEHGSTPLCSDSQGWQPIHWAAASGHTSCVRTLLDNGATRDCITNIGWTPFHAAARYGQMSCLHTLLFHLPSSEQTDIQMLSQINQETTHQPPVSSDLLNAMDHDGWTLAHILASTGQKEMLVALYQYGGVHLTVPDRRGRTPHNVATDSCKEYLSSITEGKTIRVILDASKSSTPSNDLSPHLLGQKDQSNQFVIGQLSVLAGMTWAAFDQSIGSLLANSCKMPEVDEDLPSPNGDRLSDEGPDSFNLGLGVHSIQSYVAGNLHWSVGENPSMAPHELFNLTSDIVLKLHGNQNGRLDQLAFESFLPVQMLQNYVRIIEQYKSVLFYGAPGSGKSRLAVKLAEFIQAKNKYHQMESDRSYVSLNAAFTHQDLCELLLTKGFLIQTIAGRLPAASGKAVHILVIDGVDRVGVAALFGDLLPLLETRSNQRAARLLALNSATFCLQENCIIIGTVDGVGPGTDLTVQQHFRWIRVGWDQEPFRSILQRVVLRRLVHERDGVAPSSDSSALRVLVWMCGIWRRLNEALAKLSMPEFATGPKQFFACPVDGDAPASVLRWLCLLWNYSLAPHIEDTFHRTSPSASPSLIQQQNMAASTALYVLLHRAFLPGCPLSDEEAEEYFSGFRGISAPAIEGDKPNNVKKHRRSKSLDRSKTSNKAAALARNQAHMDLISPDSQRNGRSMIPRRITPKSSKPSKQSQLTSTTSSSTHESSISHQRSPTLPASPVDDADLLESLLSHHGNIEQLIELQNTLFGIGGGMSEGGVRGGGGGGVGSGGGGEEKLKTSRSNRQLMGIGGQKLLRRSSDGAPVTTGLSRTKTKDEDGVWSVWEETV
ncbi:uncharacterized protein [Diadema antillarum]|uniref:uncharacterized protein isoform X1 n=1 Tax=Diadema antillarum TaxID=105358 RepID=UPI003A885109